MTTISARFVRKIIKEKHNTLLHFNEKTIVSSKMAQQSSNSAHQQPNMAQQSSNWAHKQQPQRWCNSPATGPIKKNQIWRNSPATWPIKNNQIWRNSPATGPIKTTRYGATVQQLGPSSTTTIKYAVTV